MTATIEYKVSPSISDAEIEGLLAEAWPEHGPYRQFSETLSKCLGHVGGYSDGRLIGFVYVAWDGEAHAFLLDTMVRPEFRSQGVGTELVRCAASWRNRTASSGCTSTTNRHWRISTPRADSARHPPG